MTNLIILFSALIVLLILQYTINRREIYSVGFISTAVFTMSAGYCILFFENYNDDISNKTVFVIISALIAICAGEFISNCVLQKSENILYLKCHKCYFNSYSEPQTPIIVKNKYIIFLFVFILTLGILRYYNLYIVSLKYGNPHKIMKAIAYTRLIYVKGEIEGNRLLSYGCTFGMAVAYTFIFVFFYNLLICKHKNFLVLLPTIAYTLIPISSTGRVEYIQFLVVAFSVFVICYRNSKNWKTNGNIKILLAAVMVFLTFILVFRYIGTLRDKWDSSSYIFTDLIGYLSAGIYGLDCFLKEGIDYSQSIGYESLTWLFSIINRFFGTNIKTVSFQPLFTVGSISSNIYTGLKSFIQDFYIVGMLTIYFMLSFFYTVWLNSIKNTEDIKRCFLRIIGFSIYIYPFTMISIAGTFNAILTTGYVLLFVFLIILNKLIVNPKKCKDYIGREVELGGESENSNKNTFSQSN